MRVNPPWQSQGNRRHTRGGAPLGWKESSGGGAGGQGAHPDGLVVVSRDAVVVLPVLALPGALRPAGVAVRVAAVVAAAPAAAESGATVRLDTGGTRTAPERRSHRRNFPPCVASCVSSEGKISGGRTRPAAPRAPLPPRPPRPPRRCPRPRPCAPRRAMVGRGPARKVSSRSPHALRRGQGQAGPPRCAPSRRFPAPLPLLLLLSPLPEQVVRVAVPLVVRPRPRDEAHVPGGRSAPLRAVLLLGLGLVERAELLQLRPAGRGRRRVGAGGEREHGRRQAAAPGGRSPELPWRRGPRACSSWRPRPPRGTRRCGTSGPP